MICIWRIKGCCHGIRQEFFILNHFDEYLYKKGIELFPGELDQLFDGFFCGKRIPVGSLGSHGVIGISHRQDPGLQRDLLAVQPGRAVIVVTHDSRVFTFANRIATMEDGRIESDETTTRGA